MADSQSHEAVPLYQTDASWLPFQLTTSEFQFGEMSQNDPWASMIPASPAPKTKPPAGP
jgi:hypothetical protein